MQEGSLSSTPSLAFIIVCILFDGGHSDWHEMIPHCGFDLHFSNESLNQFILKEISPGCSLEGLMLKLKLQYFGHLMRRGVSLENILMLGGIGAGGEGDDRG